MAGIIFPTPELIIPISKLLCPILAYPFWPGLKVPAPSSSGISIENAFENSSNGNSTTTVTISGAQSGDVTYAFQAGASTGSYPSGYSGLTSISEFAGGSTLNISRKVLTGADTSCTFPSNGYGGVVGTACGVLLFRGVNATPEDATTTTLAEQGSGQPDGPSITTITNGAYVISAICANSSTAAPTGPSGYDKLVDIVGTGSSLNTLLGLAIILKETAGAENPGAWSGVSYGTPTAWCTGTVAVRPA